MRSLLLALLLFALPAWAENYIGTVVGVTDGDTLTLLDTDRQQHKVRIAGIDAPEKDQPYGQRSKQNLSAMAYRQEARAECGKLDRYGRDVCTVYVNGKMWGSPSSTPA